MVSNPEYVYLVLKATPDQARALKLHANRLIGARAVHDAGPPDLWDLIMDIITDTRYWDELRREGPRLTGVWELSDITQHAARVRQINNRGGR